MTSSSSASSDDSSSDVEISKDDEADTAADEAEIPSAPNNEDAKVQGGAGEDSWLEADWPEAVGPNCWGALAGDLAWL